ncbi:MAG TPA: hypothetical protein VFE07_02460 [Marmoricola sp.]|jgi:hypothetical protein|nr:hypothetical protein [Marmoricola sp.]
MTAAGSMQYTIGSALQRACDAGQAVEVLVDNHWVSGRIAGLDGLGVVLEGDHHERSVVRLERVAVVRVSEVVSTAVGQVVEVPDWSAAALPEPQAVPV